MTAQLSFLDDPLPLWWSAADTRICENANRFHRGEGELEAFVRLCSCRTCWCWESIDGQHGTCVYVEDGSLLPGPTAATDLCEAWHQRIREEAVPL